MVAYALQQSCNQSIPVLLILEVPFSDKENIIWSVVNITLDIYCKEKWRHICMKLLWPLTCKTGRFTQTLIPQQYTLVRYSLIFWMDIYFLNKGSLYHCFQLQGSAVQILLRVFFGFWARERKRVKKIRLKIMWTSHF